MTKTRKDLGHVCQAIERLAYLRTAFVKSAAAFNRPSADTPGDADGPSGLSFPSAQGVPQSLARFEIVRELGRGGLGIVFLAFDPVLKRDVALKIPRPEALLTPGLRRRFGREAQAAARLTHPNLVAVYEVGEAGPVCYIAAAYSNGQNLAAWLASQTKPVPPRMAAQTVAQLADGIEYAHSQGVLHRDLKPSNVLLESRGPAAVPEERSPDTELPFTPKITDFGLAHIEDLAGTETRTGLVMGTPSYMAPEQAEGRTRDIGPATDIYGLGAILYELLTRSRVFQGTSDADTLHRVIADEPQGPRRLRADMPRDLEAICLKCLEKRPARRYRSTAQLADDLRRFLAGEPTLARPLGIVGRAWKWTRPRPTAAALLGVTLLAATALVVGSLVYSARLTSAYQPAEENRRQAEAQRNEAETQRHEAESRRSEAQSLVRDLRREVYVKDMEGALQTWEQGDALRALALLDKYQPKTHEEDLRGFEWYHLLRRFKDQGRTLLGHLGAVHHVAASPDGTRVATAGRDARIQLWETQQWKAGATLRGHKGDVNWVSFSPDGEQLASASDVGSVRLWNVATREGRIVAQYEDKVAAAVYGPDRQTLLVATRHGQISLIELASGIARWSLDRGDTVKSLVLSPDGKEMAIAFESVIGHPAEQWDLTTSVPTRLNETLSTRGLEFILDYILQYSLDGQTLVAGTSSGVLASFARNVSPHEPRYKLQLWSKNLDVIVMAPDGRTLAAAGGEGVIRLVDIATGRELQTFVGHHDRVQSLAWLPDAAALVSASEDGTVKVWSPRQTAQGPETVCELPHVDGPSGFCWPRLRFGADGQQLWTSTLHGVCNIDLASGQVTQRLSADRTTGDLFDVAYALERGLERVLVSSENGSRQVWDLTDNRIIFSVPLDTEQFQRRRATLGANRYADLGDISNNGAQVVAPDLQGGVIIWNVDSDQQILQLSKRYTGPIIEARFSPDGRRVVVTTFEGTIDLFDAATGGHLATFKDSHTPIFDPDGRFFIQQLAGRKDRFSLVRLDQLRTSSRELQLPRHRESALAITHDGRTFVTVRPSGTHSELCLWNIAAGQPMFVMDHNRPENIVAAAFSPDGTMLATLNYCFDQWKVLLWRANAPDSGARLPSANSGPENR